MAITKGTTYTDTIASGQTFAIEGVDVPNDADIAILIIHGYDYSAQDPGDDFVDESNFDGDSDDHFTHIISAGDADEPCVGIWKLEYGDTGFPSRGASGITLDVSLAYNVRYGGGAAELFFLSGVDIGSAVIDTDSVNNDSGGWVASLTGVDVDDFTIIAATAYNTAVESTPTGEGQTEIVEGNVSTMYYGAAYEVGESGPSVGCGASAYMGGVACAIAAAAAAGGIDIPIAMYHYMNH